ncbi:MAG TPA: hypothetical protein VGA45_14465, partial [Actinomycetota bacterium]
MSLTVEERVETPPDEREGLWRLAGAWRGVGIAIGIFALTRVVQLVMLAWLGSAAKNGESVRAQLLEWDAGWFLKVATEGYPHAFTYDGATGQL